MEENKNNNDSNDSQFSNTNTDRKKVCKKKARKSLDNNIDPNL